jgi:hypothetical protein
LLFFGLSTAEVMAGGWAPQIDAATDTPSGIHSDHG